MFPFKNSLLGVDIGTRTLKGVKLVSERKRIRVENYFYQDLSLLGGDLSDKKQLSDSLKAVVELQKFKNAAVASSFPDREVFHMVLELPTMKPADLGLAVNHELSENTGIEKNKLTFDFISEEILDEEGKNAEGKLKINAYGARQEIVAEHVKLLSKASLRAKTLEPDILAVLCMLKFNDYIDPSLVYAVFDLGESHQTSALIQGGKVISSRSTPGGFGLINQVLMEKKSLSYSEAEQKKVAYDFTSNEGQEVETTTLIEEFYAGFFSKIKASLDGFQEHLKEVLVDQIILVGGGSQVKDIEKYFQMFFKIKTVVANPLKNIDIYRPLKLMRMYPNPVELSEVASHMGVAIGLALAGLVPDEDSK